MADQFSDLVKIAGITILITFLWAASVAYTYWDTHKHGLPSSTVLIWLLVVALLPFLGFIAYMAAKVLIGNRMAREDPRVWSSRHDTPLKRPVMQQSPTSTLLASDTARQPTPQAQGAEESTAVPPKESPKYLLTISYGPDLGKEFDIDYLPVRIGRGPSAAIRLDGDLGVSREHAELYERAGHLRIRDLNSTHGTQVNGVNIEDQGLTSGDRIQVGLTVLAVTMGKG
jgi:hypothetical protein